MSERDQQTKPGDVFGECPKCHEMWELMDWGDNARPTGTAPDKWECDHCGYSLSIADAINFYIERH